MPVFVKDFISQRRELLNELNKMRNELVKNIYEILASNFAANGGCENCRGRGWVVTWDTLDSLSGCYAEYGACPNPACTPETRRESGLHPEMTKYDDNRGVKNPVRGGFMWSQLMIPTYDETIHNVELDIKLLENIQKCPEKGMTVTVSRGRKGRLGYTGQIFWSKYNAGGTRIGIIDKSLPKLPDGKDDVEWNWASNVDVVMTPEIYRELNPAFNTFDIEGKNV